MAKTSKRRKAASKKMNKAPAKTRVDTAKAGKATGTTAAATAVLTEAADEVDPSLALKAMEDNWEEKTSTEVAAAGKVEMMTTLGVSVGKTNAADSIAMARAANKAKTASRTKASNAGLLPTSLVYDSEVVAVKSGRKSAGVGLSLADLEAIEDAEEKRKVVDDETEKNIERIKDFDETSETKAVLLEAIDFRNTVSRSDLAIKVPIGTEAVEGVLDDLMGDFTTFTCDVDWGRSKFNNRPSKMTKEEYRVLSEALVGKLMASDISRLVEAKAVANSFINSHAHWCVAKAVKTIALGERDGSEEVNATPKEEANLIRVILDLAVVLELSEREEDEEEIFEDDDDDDFASASDGSGFAEEDEEEEEEEDNLLVFNRSVIADTPHIGKPFESGSKLLNIQFKGIMEAMADQTFAISSQPEMVSKCCSTIMIAAAPLLMMFGVKREQFHSFIDTVYDEGLEEGIERKEATYESDEVVSAVESAIVLKDPATILQTPKSSSAAVQTKANTSVRRAGKRMVADTPKVPLTLMLLFAMFTLVSAMARASMLQEFSQFLTPDILTALIDVTTLFNPSTIGRMDSKVYRTMIEAIRVETGTSVKTLALTIMFSCFMKNRTRLITAIDTSTELKTNPEVVLVKGFLTSHCCDYTQKSSKKVPLVKLADSFANLSVLYFTAFMPNLTVTMLMSTSFFGMLKLSDFMQDLHEMVTRYFWMVTISGTHNTGAGRNAQHKVSVFYTDIYQNTRTDNMYPMNRNAIPYTDGFIRLKSVSVYIKHIKASFSFTENVTTEFIPPRKDWRMFHPRYATAADGVSTRNGDYDRNTGAWVAGATTGLLSDWISTLDETTLEAAPSVTIIKINDTESTFTHRDTNPRT